MDCVNANRNGASLKFNVAPCLCTIKVKKYDFKLRLSEKNYKQFDQPDFSNSFYRLKSNIVSFGIRMRVVEASEVNERSNVQHVDAEKSQLTRCWWPRFQQGSP